MDVPHNKAGMSFLFDFLQTKVYYLNKHNKR